MAKAKRQKTTDYKLEKIEGYDEPVLVRRFANGAFIVRDDDSAGSGAEGYDSKGRWVGFGPVAELEKWVESGRVNILNHYEACELENWSFWNGCVDSGDVPLQYDERTQLIAAGSDTYLRAVREDDGWTTDWLERSEVEEQYYNEELQCFELTYANKPFRLE